MEEPAKEHYLRELKQRIADQYFFSERVLAGIVDEIAPVMRDLADKHDRDYSV